MQKLPPPPGCPRTHVFNSSDNNGKVRNSSVELFRLIAAFYVLVVHWNGWFVGGMPDSFDLQNISAFRVGQAFIEALTCVCVNLFLLITGYFGVKLKWQTIVRIYLLLVSIYIPFYLVSCIKLGEAFSLGALVDRLFAFSRAGYFVQCYVMLIFMSPVLNAFIEGKNRSHVLLWTIALASVAGYFDFWLNISALGFGRGYAMMHFMLIYMIGRTIFLFKKELLSISKLFWIVGYFVCTMMIALMYMYFNMAFIYSYTCPLVILSSICFFVPFLYKFFYSPIINWFAKGAFAIYVIQVTNPVYYKLRIWDKSLLEYFPYPFYWLISLAFASVFMLICILYDKIANYITKPIENYIMTKFKFRKLKIS